MNQLEPHVSSSIHFIIYNFAKKQKNEEHPHFLCLHLLFATRFYLTMQTYNHKKSSCARTDVAVQKVESGKFNKITLTEDLSGRVHICTGCGFLFHVFFVIGFYQSLALRKRGVAEHTRSCIKNYQFTKNYIIMGLFTITEKRHKNTAGMLVKP